jgi:membrane protein required for colicin V production
MPSYVDLGVLAVVLISALLAMVRGFTREVLAIGSWVAAAAAAVYLRHLVEPHLIGQPYMDKESVRQITAMGLIFLVALVVVSIITVKLSDLVLDSRVGALDRSLGFVFGAARGFLLCVIAFLFFQWLAQGKEPEMLKNARMRPILSETGDKLVAALPDMSFLSVMLKNKLPQGAIEDAPADAPNDAPTPAPAPVPQRRGDAAPRVIAPAVAPAAPAAQAQDRRAMDSLIQRAQQDPIRRN